MKMATKSGTRAKAAVKPVKKAAGVKPVKKTVKQNPLTKGELEWLKLNRVPLDEVEVLAAKAVKMIKAKRTLSADKKAEKLARVAATLERARGRGGLSKGGAWDLEHPFGLGLIVHDWEAVLK